MGSTPSSPEVKYAPQPPPPTTAPVPTQSFKTQLELTKISNAQQQLNMEVGAELDRANEEFFAGQDIRRLQTQGAEQRLSTQVAGEEQRKTVAATGTQERLNIAATGQQQRATVRETGAQERLTVETTGAQQRLTQAQLLAGQERQISLTGQEQRATVGKTAEEQRLTNLQQEMFRRYQEERDYQQSRSAYRS